MSKLITLFSLILITFSALGGCFFGISTSDDDDGGFFFENERVQGTITQVIPSRTGGVENIRVVVTDNDSGRTYSDITDGTGFFRIEGQFEGSPDIEFLDETDGGNLLASLNLNVFPNARLDLGEIRLINQNVSFEDDIQVTFVADILENNCTVRSGTIKVLATNGDSIEVIVQVLNSTDIVNNGEDITCDDLITGFDIRIDGFLLPGNNVEATRIEVD